MLKMSDFSALPQVGAGMSIEKAKEGFSRWGTREALAEKNENLTERQRSAIAFKSFYLLMTTLEGREWLIATLMGSLAHTMFVILNNGLRKAVIEGGVFSDDFSGDPPVQFAGFSEEDLSKVLGAHIGEKGENLVIAKVQSLANARVPSNQDGDNDWKSPVGADAVRAQHAMLDLFQSPDDWKNFFTAWRNLFVGRANTPFDQRRKLDSSVYGRGIKEVQAGKMAHIPGLFDDRSVGGRLPAGKYARPEEVPVGAPADSPEVQQYLAAAREPGRNKVSVSIGDMVAAKAAAK